MTEVILNPKGDGLTNGSQHTPAGNVAVVSPNVGRRLVDTGAALYTGTFDKIVAEGTNPWSGNPLAKDPLDGTEPTKAPPATKAPDTAKDPDATKAPDTAK